MLGLQPALAANCDIDGRLAVEEARSGGFTFDFTQKSGDGECSQGDDDPWFMASSAEDKTLVCEAKLFAGHDLANGWTVHRITLKGAAVTIPVYPRSGAKNMTLRFNLVSQNGTDKQAFLNKVTLTGPKCKAWADAFHE